MGQNVIFGTHIFVTRNFLKKVCIFDPFLALFCENPDSHIYTDPKNDHFSSFLGSDPKNESFFKIRHKKYVMLKIIACHIFYEESYFWPKNHILMKKPYFFKKMSNPCFFEKIAKFVFFAKSGQKPENRGFWRNSHFLGFFQNPRNPQKSLKMTLLDHFFTFFRFFWEKNSKILQKKTWKKTCFFEKKRGSLKGLPFLTPFSRFCDFSKITKKHEKTRIFRVFFDFFEKSDF